MSGFLWVVGGIVGTVVVAGGALVGLSLMETPKPSCADGAIAITKAAENSFNSKWNNFDAALKGGGAATVTLTEEEITSRAVRYLAEKDLPAKNVQVNLCPGPGKGQADMTVQVLGRDAKVLVAGHLDLTSKPGRVAVDSVQVGQVPEQITTGLVNRLIEVANIEVPAGIKEATSTSTSVTLKGQK